MNNVVCRTYGYSAFAHFPPVWLNFHISVSAAEILASNLIIKLCTAIATANTHLHRYYILFIYICFVFVLRFDFHINKKVSFECALQQQRQPLQRQIAITSPRPAAKGRKEAMVVAKAASRTNFTERFSPTLFHIICCLSCNLFVFLLPYSSFFVLLRYCLIDTIQEFYIIWQLSLINF